MFKKKLVLVLGLMASSAFIPAVASMWQRVRDAATKGFHALRTALPNSSRQVPRTLPEPARLPQTRLPYSNNRISRRTNAPFPEINQAQKAAQINLLREFLRELNPRTTPEIYPDQEQQNLITNTPPTLLMPGIQNEDEEDWENEREQRELDERETEEEIRRTDAARAHMDHFAERYNNAHPVNQNSTPQDTTTTSDDEDETDNYEDNQVALVPQEDTPNEGLFNRLARRLEPFPNRSLTQDHVQQETSRTAVAQPAAPEEEHTPNELREYSNAMAPFFGPSSDDILPLETNNRQRKIANQQDETPIILVEDSQEPDGTINLVPANISSTALVTGAAAAAGLICMHPRGRQAAKRVSRTVIQTTRNTQYKRTLPAGHPQPRLNEGALQPDMIRPPRELPRLETRPRIQTRIDAEFRNITPPALAQRQQQLTLPAPVAQSAIPLQAPQPRILRTKEPHLLLNEGALRPDIIVPPRGPLNLERSASRRTIIDITSRNVTPPALPQQQVSLPRPAAQPLAFPAPAQPRALPEPTPQPRSTTQSRGLPAPVEQPALPAPAQPRSQVAQQPNLSLNEGTLYPDMMVLPRRPLELAPGARQRTIVDAEFINITPSSPAPRQQQLTLPVLVSQPRALPASQSQLALPAPQPVQIPENQQQLTREIIQRQQAAEATESRAQQQHLEQENQIERIQAEQQLRQRQETQHNVQARTEQQQNANAVQSEIIELVSSGRLDSQGREILVRQTNEPIVIPEQQPTPQPRSTTQSRGLPAPVEQPALPAQAQPRSQITQQPNLSLNEGTLYPDMIVLPRRPLESAPGARQRTIVDAKFRDITPSPAPAPRQQLTLPTPVSQPRALPASQSQLALPAHAPQSALLQARAIEQPIRNQPTQTRGIIQRQQATEATESRAQQQHLEQEPQIERTQAEQQLRERQETQHNVQVRTERQNANAGESEIIELVSSGRLDSQGREILISRQESQIPTQPRTLSSGQPNLPLNEGILYPRRPIRIDTEFRNIPQDQNVLRTPRNINTNRSNFINTNFPSYVPHIPFTRLPITHIATPFSNQEQIPSAQERTQPSISLPRIIRNNNNSVPNLSTTNQDNTNSAQEHQSTETQTVPVSEKQKEEKEKTLRDTEEEEEEYYNEYDDKEPVKKIKKKKKGPQKSSFVDTPEEIQSPTQSHLAKPKQQYQQNRDAGLLETPFKGDGVTILQDNHPGNPIIATPQEKITPTPIVSIVGNSTSKNENPEIHVFIPKPPKNKTCHYEKETRIDMLKRMNIKNYKANYDNMPECSTLKESDITVTSSDIFKEIFITLKNLAQSLFRTLTGSMRQ